MSRAVRPARSITGWRRTLVRGLVSLGVWTFLVGGVVEVLPLTRVDADPSDDFSFSLRRASTAQPASDAVFRLMSEGEVLSVLEDRLDQLPRSLLPELATHLMRLCRRYQFDPAFILSLIEVESSFRVTASSSAGAIGLMQLMPATAKILMSRPEEWNIVVPRPGAWAPRGLTRELVRSAREGRVSPQRYLLDPFVNTTLGVAYLAFLRDRYRGLSPYYLVAAYNLGPFRLDELRARKSFRPTGTKAYFEKIRAELPGVRFHRAERARQASSSAGRLWQPRRAVPAVRPPVVSRVREVFPLPIRAWET